MPVNISKVRHTRFWKKWRTSGSVVCKATHDDVTSSVFDWTCYEICCAEIALPSSSGIGLPNVRTPGVYRFQNHGGASAALVVLTDQRQFYVNDKVAIPFGAGLVSEEAKVWRTLMEPLSEIPARAA